MLSPLLNDTLLNVFSRCCSADVKAENWHMCRKGVPVKLLKLDRRHTIHARNSNRCLVPSNSLSFVHSLYFASNKSLILPFSTIFLQKACLGVHYSCVNSLFLFSFLF